MAVITTDWDAIQERNIDPHSPVTSDNHNKLLKTFGNFKMYVNGFDISIKPDASLHKILATVSIGTAYVQYMVIEMTADSVLELCETPTNAAEYYIVLEYTYRNIQPVPIAYIKVIRAENWTPSNQLRLYKFNTDNWTGTPSQSVLDDWWKDGNLEDLRRDVENTPTWANTTYLRLDGKNVASSNIKIDAYPIDDNDITNKGYVDDLVYNKHHDAHNDYFVRKNANNDSSLFGTVIENIDIAKGDPYLKLTDCTVDDDGSVEHKGGLTMAATSNYAYIDVSKDVFRISIGGQDPSKSYNSEAQSGTKVEINSRGITGALWCADVAEYFTADSSIEEMPEEGTCICIHNGKAVFSSDEGDPSVIGCVSYHPAHILGGSTDFEKEFKEKHKIPVAVIGQIKNVPYYSSYNLEHGGLLIAGKDGMFKVISQFDPMNVNGSVIGKTMNSIYPTYGDKPNRVDVIIK